MLKCFPLIGALPWLAAIGAILVSVAVIPWADMGDGPPLGVMAMWGRILAACNLLALVIALVGIAATWRCIRGNASCGRVLAGITISLLMPLVCVILILLK